jgi:hypothetical protein
VLSGVTESAESDRSPPQATVRIHVFHFVRLITIAVQGKIIPHTSPSEDLPPEKMASIDDNFEESQDISTVEANSFLKQPPVEHQIEEAAVPEITEPLPLPLEEIHKAIVPLVTSTGTTMSQPQDYKDSSSPYATYIDNSEDKNAQTEELQIAVEDARLDEEENDRETGEALNQRQEEEEEETHREEESKEEEEESKDGDNRKEEEEESREEEGNEEAKLSEEKENQEEMKNRVMDEEKESKEETKSNPAAENNSQRRNPPQGQDEQMDVDHEQDDQTSLGNIAELDMETESEIAATPVPEIARSPCSLNPAEAVDDEHTSGDEPVVFTRRMCCEKRFHLLKVHF